MSEMVNEFLSITNQTKGKIKILPFVDILKLKDAILGKKYDLSIAIVGTHTAKKINIETRQKTYIPNTLSFVYEKNSGEIILCPIVIKKQALKNKSKLLDYSAYIIIHSMLHLKGLDHGDKMEKLEEKFLNQFGYKI